MSRGPSTEHIGDLPGRSKATVHIWARHAWVISPFDKHSSTSNPCRHDPRENKRTLYELKEEIREDKDGNVFVKSLERSL